MSPPAVVRLARVQNVPWRVVVLDCWLFAWGWRFFNCCFIFCLWGLDYTSSGSRCCCFSLLIQTFRLVFVFWSNPRFHFVGLTGPCAILLPVAIGFSLVEALVSWGKPHRGHLVRLPGNIETMPPRCRVFLGSGGGESEGVLGSILPFRNKNWRHEFTTSPT